MITTTTTTRVHMNPKEALGSLEHVRSKGFRNRESHVDSCGGKFELWLDKGVYETYSEIFSDVLESYNDNQKRKDRRIADDKGDAVAGYIQQIQTGKRGVREQVVYRKNPKTGEKEAVARKKETQGQRVLYELVMSAGNCEKFRDDGGRIVYDKSGHEIHPYRLPEELHKRCLERFFKEFEQMYPHFRLCTVAYHGDEFYINAKGKKEFGISHLHLCFVPFADGYSRGLTIQASISKALSQMGFGNGEDDNGVWRNAYYFFTQDVQRRFEGIIQEEYHKYLREKGLPEKDITFEHPAAGKALPNLDPAEFRRIRDLERRATNASSIIEEAEETAKERLSEASKQAFKRKSEVYSKMHEDVEKAEKKVADADRYYSDKVAAADALTRDTQKACKDSLKIVSDKAATVDKIVEQFISSVQKEDAESAPAPATVKRWMQKVKIRRNGKEMSVYDMYAEDCKKEKSLQRKQKKEELLRMQREINSEMKIQQKVVNDIVERGWDDLEHEYDIQHELV